MLIKSSKFRYLLSVLLISIAVIAYAKINSSIEEFSQAKDFPEGALIYAQFQDLPALYKIWDESEIKQKYLESTNFNEFENNHLAMKLVSRLDEFQSASDFPLDISVILGSSETKAAIAVYDIGRLEFVFVAPLSEEKMIASNFVLNKSAFEETKMEDGTFFYSKNIEADRGRQKQKLLFATLRGRFILATDEVKFFKTLMIISGKSKGRNLFDAPEFNNLSAKIKPHQATIWVDQRKLNDDWYFKHYWAFDLEKLKKIRAGIFDFEIQENKLLEHRKFLLNEKADEKVKISANEISNLQRFIPENVPYFKLQSVESSSETSAQKIYQTLFDGFLVSSKKDKNYAPQNSSNRYYFEDYLEDFRENDYIYLGGKYESEINENDADFEVNKFDSGEKTELIGELQRIIQEANPKISASLISPQILPMPLFFECRRGFILSLQNAKNLDRGKLENAISKLAYRHLTVSEANVESEWKTIEENGKIWRELKMPMLGLKLIYTMKNNEIIFANSVDLLNLILENNSEKDAENDRENENLDEFAVIRLNQHEAAFGSVMSKINQLETQNEENESVDFFVDNVGSLFEVLSDVNRFEMRKSSSKNYISEELEFILN